MNSIIMAGHAMKSILWSMKSLKIDHVVTRSSAYYRPPRYRPPSWFAIKESHKTDDNLTLANKQFIEEVLQEKYETQPAISSPLSGTTDNPAPEWTPKLRRVGLIARKIGNYPVWLKDGKKVQTTLLQVVDNHVVKYIPPEEFDPKISKADWAKYRRFGCLLVGSETVDPSTLTKNYCGLFNAVGMMPKKILCRFSVSPEAALPSGTPLVATHFRVGDYLDVRAKTIDRGFQGVMKRWGFKGMPASHGVTKTHRRPGNIGSGGNKARVMPGQKMPGHMGNSWRILRGVKILRINTKHNVIWTQGVGIPGETGAMCYLYDTMLPLRKHKTAPPFPTHIPTEDLPLEYYDEEVHQFEAPTIAYEES